jgi:ribonuclease HI
MGSKKKFYAVAAGRKPGIYTNWPEAQAQVMGFKGAVYKGFPTREEAEAWIKNPTYSPSAKKYKNKVNATTAESSPKKGEITIYTDGGARYNPGPGGYGIVIVYDDKQEEYSGGFRLTTNNRMELTACIVALQKLKYRDKPISLFSDSSYVVNGITRGWARNWRKKGWIKSDKQPAINPDLWGMLLDLIEQLDITFHWVKGHSGNPLNERCDELAVAASKKENLPEDKGYRGNGEL